jgi:hypothetical protein
MFWSDGRMTLARDMASQVLADKFIAPCPARVGLKELIVIGIIAAIGMTIALFVSVEAYRSCPGLEADAKLGSLMSVLCFPIAAAVGLGLKVHVDSGKKSAGNVNDAIESMFLIEEHQHDAEAHAIAAAATRAHESEMLELRNQAGVLAGQLDALKKHMRVNGLGVPEGLLKFVETTVLKRLEAEDEAQAAIDEAVRASVPVRRRDSGAPCMCACQLDQATSHTALLLHLTSCCRARSEPFSKSYARALRSQLLFQGGIDVSVDRLAVLKIDRSS